MNNEFRLPSSSVSRVSIRQGCRPAPTLANVKRERGREEGFHLTSCEPGAHQIHRTREQACLQSTQHDSQPGKLFPRFDKAHPEHNDAPEGSDSGEMDTRADLADDNGRWRLEEGVGDEEDERDNTLGCGNERQRERERRGRQARQWGGTHILIAIHFEIFAQAGDAGRGEVRPIDQTHAVQHADS